MSNENKQTVGAAAIERQKKDEKINPIELQREIHEGKNSKRSFEEEIMVCLERGKEAFNKDFFIVVLFKKERILKNVVRNLFFPRQSCPTPEFDQVVYHYHKERDELEFLWVVPDKDFINSLPVLADVLVEEQDELVKFAYKFRNKDLDRLSAKLNNETKAIV